MKISKNSLQARINNIAKDTGIDATIVLKTFFFDAFIRRLASSPYAHDFIMKGGFLLSRKLGLSLRATVDVDFLIRNQRMEEENIRRIVEEVCAIDADDGVVLEYQKMVPIREEDLYGGFNVSILAHFEKMRDIVSLDIATGDPITPSAVLFIYKTMIEKEELQFSSYNYETIISEKMQTLLQRGVMNSRCKDFYDLFIIYRMKWDEVSKQDLPIAFGRTCAHRGKGFTKEEASRILDLIGQSDAMHVRWSAYSRKNSFARSISLEETLCAVRSILEFLY